MFVAATGTMTVFMAVAVVMGQETAVGEFAVKQMGDDQNQVAAGYERQFKIGGEITAPQGDGTHKTHAHYQSGQGKGLLVGPVAGNNGENGKADDKSDEDIFGQLGLQPLAVHSQKWDGGDDEGHGQAVN